MLKYALFMVESLFFLFSLPIALAWCACTHTLENHPQKPVDGSHSLSPEPRAQLSGAPRTTGLAPKAPGRPRPAASQAAVPAPALSGALRLRAGAPRWTACPSEGHSEAKRGSVSFSSLCGFPLVRTQPGFNCTICYSSNRCVSPEVSSLPVSRLAGLLSQLICFQLHEEDSSSLPSPTFSIRVGAQMRCVCVCLVLEIQRKRESRIMASILRSLHFTWKAPENHGFI